MPFYKEKLAPVDKVFVQTAPFWVTKYQEIYWRSTSRAAAVLLLVLKEFEVHLLHLPCKRVRFHRRGSDSTDSRLKMDRKGAPLPRLPSFHVNMAAGKGADAEEHAPAMFGDLFCQRGTYIKG
jgi:hypothetical protein